MSELFALLLLLSLLGMTIGIAKPTLFTKLLRVHSTRPVLGCSFGFLAFVFLILVGVTGPQTVNLKDANAKAAVEVPTTSSRPVITSKMETSTQAIPFTTSTEEDSSLAKGTNQVTVQGVNGIQTQTYKVTYSNGQETNRNLVSSVVTTPPVNEVIAQGTYVAPTPAASPAPQTPTQTQTTTPSSCYPLTNGGNCYEPGEYCRDSDHDASGMAGDGESITCLDNNGWRWEPK